MHFVDDGAARAQPGDAVELTGSEAHHAASVRRVRPGESVTLTDGRGVWLSGTVADAQKTRVEITVSQRRDIPAPSPRIFLAQALAKGDRDELAVQAATELGIDGIIPWQATRSVSRWQGPKADKGRSRWQSIVREAAKQALRAWIPEVEAVHPTSLLAERATSMRVLILDPWTEARFTTLETDGRDILLVVGPEGGIAPEEISALEAAGAERVKLGDSVLRTSTAGPAALALLNARVGRW
nr:16S rRNA (uracil(1498)-N(3))-methyltransferase [Microbacterium amylolyticum]